MSENQFNNTFRLSPGDWCLAAAVLLAAFIMAPRLWTRLERVDFGADYRVPYEAGTNYWFVARRARAAGAAGQAVIIGDSVVWGHYAEAESTLAAHLNRRAGEPRFANLGVDGLHPAAMRGFFRHYWRPPRGRTVILHLNLLWLSSPEHDLSDPATRRFNHPRLLPLVFGRPPPHRPTLPEAVATLAERGVPFFSWVQHLRQHYFENLNLLAWTLLNPSGNPFRAIDFQAPAPDTSPRGRPVSWREAGLPGGQDPDWVDPEESLQWRAFLETAAMLERRGNRVLVLVGPFNTHLLGERAAARYGALLEEVTGRLEREGIGHHVFETLAADLFADASHPLAEGYRLMAGELAGGGQGAFLATRKP